MPLLSVRGLEVGFGASAPVLAGIDLHVDAGETVALVGESGSGKSLTALSLVRLLPRGAVVRGGSIRFDGEDVLAMPRRRLDRLRGGSVAMLFQQPLAMLDPTATVGSQVAEAVALHTGCSGRAAAVRAVELLREVGVPAPEARAGCYAHQLSGGTAQRVMIAAALAGNPRLLVADEPTTALDATVQLQILRLLAQQRADRRLATLLITHDLGVVSALADRILVLYAGRVVEEGARRDILERPQHPYTQALVRASLLQAGADGTLFALPSSVAPGVPAGGCCFLPRCITADTLALHGACARHEPELRSFGAPGQRVRCCAPGPPPAPAVPAMPTPRVVSVAAGVLPATVSFRGVGKRFRLGGGVVLRALDQVSFEIRPGEALGLVGESGCGKTTLARLLLHLALPTAGHIHALGREYGRLGRGALRQLHRDTQLVFQDPASALDPRMRLGDSLDAVLAQNGAARAGRRAAVLAVLADVGLDARFLGRLPRECSGGQLQRAVIARALLMQPKLLVCDEPTSALDASIRAQILNLLHDLRARNGLTVLMITHDLRVVRHVCDRVAVMYLGEIVELADTATLFARPAHPYTQALAASALLDEHALNRSTGRVQGDPPSPLNPPAGCRFHTRCPLAGARCAAEHPPLTAAGAGHVVRCWHWQEAQAASRG